MKFMLKSLIIVLSLGVFNLYGSDKDKDPKVIINKKIDLIDRMMQPKIKALEPAYTLFDENPDEFKKVLNDALTQLNSLEKALAKDLEQIEIVEILKSYRKKIETLSNPRSTTSSPRSLEPKATPGIISPASDTDKKTEAAPKTESTTGSSSSSPSSSSPKSEEGKKQKAKKNKAASSTQTLTDKLFDAIQKKQVSEAIKLIKSKEINLDNKDNDGDTALILASRNECNEIVQSLLKHGANVNAQNEFGETALIEAVNHGFIRIIKLLLKAPNINVNAKDNDGNSALMVAWNFDEDMDEEDLYFYEDNIIYKMIQLLLEAPGIDINVKNDEGYTILHLVDTYNTYEIAKLLIAKGADVNIQASSGETPLMEACKANDPKIVELLLAHPNININIKDYDGKTILDYVSDGTVDDKEIINLLNQYVEKTKIAKVKDSPKSSLSSSSSSSSPKSGEEKKQSEKVDSNELIDAIKNNRIDEAIKLIESNKINLEAKDNDGNTALILVANGKPLEIVKKLLEHKANANAQNKYGNTALMYALHCKNYDIAELLLEKGADTNTKNKQGDTALHIAYQKENKNIFEVIRLLIKYNVDLNVQSKYGQTVLILAAYYAHRDIVELLLENRADVNLQNTNKQTALSLACPKDFEISKLLIDHGADINFQDNEGFTPLMRASYYDKGYEIAEHLLKQPNIKLDLQNKFGETALKLATKYGHSDIIKLLKDKGADETIKDNVEIYYKDYLKSSSRTSSITTSSSSPSSSSSSPKEEKKESAKTEDDSKRSDDKKSKDSGKKQPKSDKYAKNLILSMERNEIKRFLDSEKSMILKWIHNRIIELDIENTPTLEFDGKEEDARNKQEAILDSVNQATKDYIVTLKAVISKDIDSYVEIYEHIFKLITDETLKDKLLDPEPIRANAHYYENGYKKVLNIDAKFVKAMLDNNEREAYVLSQSSEINPNYKKINVPVLIIAAQKGYSRIVSTLLEKGAAIDARDQWGCTALMWACIKRHDKIIELLVQKGANINLQSDEGHSALIYACNHIEGYKEVEYLLKQPTIKIDVPNKLGITPLIQATIQGNFKVVQLLIAKKPNINAQDTYGDTALIYAVARPDIRDLLLKNNADVNIQNKNGDTALIKAAMSSNIEAVQSLLENKAEVNISNKDGITAFMQATAQGNLKIMQMLIDKEAKINAQDNNGQNPLTFAIEKNKQEVIELLLKKNADINISNNFGVTPFIEATAQGNLKIMQSLMDKEANINAQNIYGNTALKIAFFNNNPDVIELLLKHPKINVNIQDKNGGTPLMEATRKGDLKIMQSLMDKEAKINAQDIYGNTALKIAFLENKPEALELLLKNDADVNIPDKNGITFLMEASRKGNLKIMQLVIKKANINAQDIHGNTALIYAIDSNNPEVIELLLKNNADINIPNKRGGTTLIMAAISGNVKIMQLLIAKKPNIDTQDNNGDTALICASMHNKQEAVMLLIRNKAKKTIQNKNKKTYLNVPKISSPSISSSSSSPKEEKKESPKIEDDNDKLINALLNDNKEKAHELATSPNINPNYKDKNGFTALIIASQKGCLEIVNILLTKGADISITDKSGYTALKWAQENKHDEIVKLLLTRCYSCSKPYDKDKVKICACEKVYCKDVKCVKKFEKHKRDCKKHKEKTPSSPSSSPSIESTTPPTTVEDKIEEKDKESKKLLEVETDEEDDKTEKEEEYYPEDDKKPKTVEKTPSSPFSLPSSLTETTTLSTTIEDKEIFDMYAFQDEEEGKTEKEGEWQVVGKKPKKATSEEHRRARTLALNIVRPRMLGSTGRTKPHNLDEYLAMLEVMLHPEKGKKLKTPLADNRWAKHADWRKMSQVIIINSKRIEIHYVANTDGSYDDFKFKD